MDAKAYGKRPDVVLYINGIALGILELKRSTVSVAEGIRQNLDNQKKIFIQPFFSTIQLVMAGNDSEGLRYGTIETQEKYYLTWKEQSDTETHWGRGVKFVVQLDVLGYSARMVVEIENIDLGFAEVEKLGCEAMTAALLNTNAPDWGPSPFGIRTQLN